MVQGGKVTEESKEATLLFGLTTEIEIVTGKRGFAERERGMLMGVVVDSSKVSDERGRTMEAWGGESASVM